MPSSTPCLLVQALAIVASVAIGGMTTLLFSIISSKGESPSLSNVNLRPNRRLLLDPKTVELRNPNAGSSSVANQIMTKKEVVFTSYYTYQIDPQRKYKQSSDSIEYIHNLYATATHFHIHTVIFHDSLTQEFVDRFTNDYVSFQKVMLDPKGFTTNDFRFFPYLDYVKQETPDTIMMVDASDVFFNSNPFDYIKEHEGPKNQLFMSEDKTKFFWRSWRVPQCYGGDVAKKWPGGRNSYHAPQMYSAGVWGGKGPAVECILKCVTEQLKGPLYSKGNCNMPAVNYCVNHSPQCKGVAKVHAKPRFVNSPPNEGCLEGFPIIHNKCPDTQYKTHVDIVDDQVILKTNEGFMSEAGKADERLSCTRERRRGELPKGTKC